MGLLALVAIGSTAVADEAGWQKLEYAVAPVDNPLKGLVPYAGDHASRFPHSMEFNYLPLSALVVGQGEYDWSPLERLLDGPASRGHQTVFRVYLEYPGRSGVIPAYLVEGGLKVHRYVNTNTQPFPPKEVETPDYGDRALRRCLQDFIAALGKRYDGDPRVGFITAGLLGTWGEWHTYPRQDLWAAKEVQLEVIDAYEKAFRTTPILLRYPAGDDHAAHAPNANRRFGYHDDSFAWATLDTGRKSDSWYFLPAIKAAGPAAVCKWQTQPIGGEIRPEAWGQVFDESPADRRVQDFARSVAETHASWLMDTGMFSAKTYSAARRQRAEMLVARMGYEFYVAAVALRRQDGWLEVEVQMVNRGVAPFYYDWPAQWALVDEQGQVIKAWPGEGKLTGLLPGDPPRLWKQRLDADGVADGAYHLALGVANPMAGGHPLRFANRTQDAHAPGWLTLAPVVIAPVK